jgi:hypothetical protein
MPMGRDPSDTLKITVTQLPDGNISVEYTLIASKPPYMLGARGFGILGLGKYQITGKSIVPFDDLKRGVLTATEPEVTVEVETEEGEIGWYKDNNGQLESIPCPYL